MPPPHSDILARISTPFSEAWLYSLEEKDPN